MGSVSLLLFCKSYTHSCMNILSLESTWLIRVLDITSEGEQGTETAIALHFSLLYLHTRISDAKYYGAVINIVHLK